MKLLVDECLSEELTKLAQRRGHAEASHVAWIGKRGWKDWELKTVIIDGNWTFVTSNSIDFRGPRLRALAWVRVYNASEATGTAHNWTLL